MRERLKGRADGTEHLLGCRVGGEVEALVVPLRRIGHVAVPQRNRVPVLVGADHLEFVWVELDTELARVALGNNLAGHLGPAAIPCVELLPRRLGHQVEIPV